MLEYVRIQNLALIEDAELEFADGLNVLTGETGAGKSFILKALGFLLGDRLKADMVRPGADRAHVEAIFRLEDEGAKAKGEFKDELKDEFSDENGRELILRRDLLASGRSRLSVNGAMKPQEYVRELRDRLLSYTSQHGQQKLLQPAYQEALMEGIVADSIAHAKELFAKKAELLRALEENKAQMEAIEARRERLTEVRDLLEMQQAEIDKVRPLPNEDVELEELRMKARRQEEAGKIYDAALNMLYGSGDGSGLLDALSRFRGILEELSEEDERLKSSLASCTALMEDMQQTGSLLRRPPEICDLPEDIEQVEARLYELSKLKRTLRRDLPQILSLKEEIEEKISFLDICELDIKNLRRQEDELVSQLKKTVEEIVPIRRKACTDFCHRLEQELQGLGFNEAARVLPDFRSRALWRDVQDEAVRILWAPNPGQLPQPLDRIASGGELSRFLLALTGVTPSRYKPTFIFDEVDAGVGGVTLNTLADRLEKMAGTHQLLLVTHWPQIAARAARHFQIAKAVHDGKTYTTCKPLHGKEIHDELVRMGGGGSRGEALASALQEELGQKHAL